MKNLIETQIKPLVSVIMGVYNDEKHVEYAIKSILAQSFREFELIVVDDCSSDKSLQIVKELQSKDSRICILKNDKNLGLAASLNKALAVANGQFIARMDSDDISHSPRLEQQLKFLREKTEYALVGTSRNFFDDNGVWGHSTYEGERSLVDIYLGRSFTHPTVMIRTDVLKSVGGYTVAKETLRAEDYDLWCKVYRAGNKGYQIGQILFDYREDGDSYRKRKFRYRVDLYHLMKKWRKELGLSKKYDLWAYKPLLVGIIPAKLLLRRRQRVFQ